MVIKERYQVAKARAEELCNDNEDLLKTMMERAETIEKELQEAKKALTGKDAKLKGYEAVDEAKLQDAYYQGQYDCITTVKPKVQQKLLAYYSKGWTVALDKLQVEASSSFRVENNITIPEELVIIPNPEILAIINDESLVLNVEGARLAASFEGGTISASLSSTDFLKTIL